MVSFAAAVAAGAGIPWPRRLSLGTCKTGRGHEPEQDGASVMPLAHLANLQRVRSWSRVGLLPCVHPGLACIRASMGSGTEPQETHVTLVMLFLASPGIGGAAAGQDALLHYLCKVTPRHLPRLRAKSGHVLRQPR